MANTLTLLYYDLDNTKWVKLQNREVNPGFDANSATTPLNKPYKYIGGNPVSGCSISDQIGAPLEMELTINNRQAKPRTGFTEPNASNYTFGEDPLVNPQLGQFHNLLNEHTEIIVHETDTFMTLFVGRIYESDEKYELTRGSVLLLTCRDALEIVSRNSLADLKGDEGKIRQAYLSTVSTDDISRGGSLRFARNDLDLIRNIIELTAASDVIEIPAIANTFGTAVTSDKIDHNASNQPYYQVYDEDFVNARKQVIGDDQKAYVELKDTKGSPLGRIQKLAEDQEWKDADNNDRKRFGWTFHLDSTRQTAIYDGAESSIKPKQDFVYYRRGFNPTASPLTRGLVVKYATSQVNESTTSGTTDRIRNMFQDGFEFKGYGTKTFTHIEVEYIADKLAPHDDNIQVDGTNNNLKWIAATGQGPVGGNQINNLDQSSFPDPQSLRNFKKKPEWGGTYDLYEALDVHNKIRDPGSWDRETFALIYIKPNTGSTVDTFSVSLPDTDSRLVSPRTATTRKRRSFSQVSSLHTTRKSTNTQAFVTRNNQGSGKPDCTKTWLGNVQRQGIDEEGNHFLLLSKPQHDVLLTLDGNDLLYERSHYWDNVGNSNAPSGGQEAIVRLADTNGYPAKTRGKKTLKLGKVATFANTGYEELRNIVENNFLKANNKETKRLRKGLFSMKDYPHVRWGGTAGVVSSGSTLALDASAAGEHQISSGVTPSTPYGMRKGCSMVKSYDGTTSTTLLGDDRFVGYINTTTATTVVGSIYRADTLDALEPTIGAWASGDKYDIYVPYRAGMSIRCENLISGVNGDFIITEISYVWNNGRVGTEVEVIGINDEVVFKGRASLDEYDDNPKIYDVEDERIVDSSSLAANAYTATGVYWWHDHELWETPHISAADKKDYNTFSWSGGQVRLNGSGDLYKFLAGDTDAALTTAGYTVTSGSGINNPMQLYSQYVLYLDTAEEPNQYGYHTVRIGRLDYSEFGYQRNNTYIELVYLTAGEDVNLGSKTIGLPGTNFYSASLDFPNGMPELEFMSAFNNVWGLSNSLLSAARSIQPGSITAAIMRKGARPFASNLTFEAYQNTYNNAQWHDGSDGNATISFADPGTASNITVLAGNSVGSGSGDQAYTFLAGNTYYAYMIPDTDSKPHFTTDYAVAVTDDAFIVAIIAIDDDTTQKSPTFLPINSKVPTLSAVAIAADAITANAIKAGTIETTKLSVSAQGDLLNSNSDRAKTFAQNEPPESVTIGDIWVDTNDGNKIYRSTQAESTSHWVLVKEDNKIFRQEGITGGGSTYNNIPTSINIGDIWTDTDDQAMYFALSIGANAIVTSGSTGWMRRDDVLAINSADTSIDGGLINTARIILKEGGAATDGLFMTADATFSPTSGQSYIQMDHTSIKGVSRTGTTNTTEFELKAENGRAEFGGGKIIAGASGLTVTSTDSTQGFIKFNNSSGTVQSFLMSATNSSWDRVQLGTADCTDVYIGMDDQPPGPTRISTPTIHLVSRYLNIPGNSTNSPKIYSMPTDNPIAGDVLACNTVTTGIVSPNTSTHNIYNLHWTPASGGNSYSNIALVDGLGSIGGLQNNSADQAGDTLGLKAGLGIKLHGSTGGTPEVEIELEGAKAETGQSSYMVYYSASNMIEKTSNMWINGGASPTQFTLVNADFYMNSQRIHALSRGNSFSTCDLNFNAAADTGITGIAYNQFALVTDGFKALDVKKHPVRATVGISGNSDATYNLTVTGTAYKTGGGTHWNSTSDDRIKTEVVPLTSAVTKLSELKPISYKWSDNWQEATQAENYTMHGFLASEYKTVFPGHSEESSMTLYKVDDKWVSHLDGDIHPDRISERVENIVTINDSVLTPYLIAAIKELKAEIETLKGQIGG